MYERSALKQYQSVNLEARVMSATPHQLIQMLLEGGLTRLAQAKGALEREDLPLKGELLGKAVAIIYGLKDVLDFEAGGELATNLDRLYDYMVRRLTEANLKNDLQMIEEVAGLLREIKAGWDDIGGAAVPSAPSA